MKSLSVILLALLGCLIATSFAKDYEMKPEQVLKEVSREKYKTIKSDSVPVEIRDEIKGRLEIILRDEKAAIDDAWLIYASDAKPEPDLVRIKVKAGASQFEVVCHRHVTVVDFTRETIAPE